MPLRQRCAIVRVIAPAGVGETRGQATDIGEQVRIAFGRHMAQVGNHAFENVASTNRFENARSETDVAPGKSHKERLTPGPTQQFGPVEQIHELLSGPSQKVGRHRYSCDWDPPPTSNFDQHHGERDRDAHARVQHRHDVRVLLCVVVRCDARQADVDGNEAGERCEIAGARLLRDPVESVALGVDIDRAVDRRGNQERPDIELIGKRISRITNELGKPSTNQIVHQLSLGTGHTLDVHERYEFLSGGHVHAFAHRGGAHDGPENTLTAFQRSVDLGFRYVETDVHASSDGVLFAFHDPNLGRVTNVDATLGDLTASEIEQVVVHGDERIPRLEEVLTTWPRLRVNIDPKADAAVEPLVKAIEACAAVDRVCVGSFSGRRVEYCRRAFGGRLCTSMGPGSVAALRAASLGVPVRVTVDAPCAQIPPRAFGLPLIDRRFVETAAENGVVVHAWTIDDPDQMRRLLDLGVRGIMTDKPAALRSVLIESGMWGRV